MVDALQTSGIKKAGCERAIMGLVEKNFVTMKEFGKAKIFLCRQESIDIPPEEELVQMGEDIQNKTETLKSMCEQLEGLYASRRKLENSMTLEEAEKKCEELETGIKAAREKLESFGPSSELVTEEDKQAIELRYFLMKVPRSPRNMLSPFMSGNDQLIGVRLSLFTGGMEKTKANGQRNHQHNL